MTIVTRSINIAAKKLLLANRNLLSRHALSLRSFSNETYESNSVHFRATSTPHPLATEKNTLKAAPIPTLSGLDKDGNPIPEVRPTEMNSLKGPSPKYVSNSHLVHLPQPFGQVLGDHTGLLQNHIWTEAELQEKLTTLYHHKPQTYTDHAMQKVVSPNYLSVIHQ